VALTGAATLAIRLRQVLLLPVLGRVLGPAAYGAWSQLAAAVALISSVAGALGNAATRFIADESERPRTGRVVAGTVLPSLLLAGLLALVLSAFSSPLARHFLGVPDGGSLVIVAAWAAVGMAGGGVAQALFRGRSQFWAYNALTLFAEYGELACVVAAVALGYGLAGAVVALLAARAASALVGVAVAGRRLGFARPSAQDVGAYFAYSLPLMPEQVLLWVINVSDRYVMSHYWTNADVGEYSAAYSVGGVIGLVAIPVWVVIFPLVSRFWDEGRQDRARTYLEQTLRYLLFLTIPLAAILSALGGEVVRIFAGAGFEGAGAYVPWVATGLMLHRLQGIYTYVLMAAKRTRAVMWVHGGAAVLNVAANVVLMPRFGPVTAAYVTFATYAAAAVGMWALARRVLPTSVSPAFVAKSVGASAAIAAGLALLAPSGAAATAGAALAACAAYVGLMIALRGVTAAELASLARLFRRQG
jgi:O-antigen/teichoic acid export membrane protein